MGKKIAACPEMTYKGIKILRIYEEDRAELLEELVFSGNTQNELIERYAKLYEQNYGNGNEILLHQIFEKEVLTINNLKSKIKEEVEIRKDTLYENGEIAFRKDYKEGM